MALKLTSDTKKQILGLGVPTGATYRMDHKDCTAGTDTRRRLYITHDSSGDMLVYCHNCGQGTLVPSGAPRTRTVHPIISPALAAAPPVRPLTTLGELFMEAWGLSKGDEYGVDNAEGEGIVFPFTGGHQIRWLKGNALKWQTFNKPSMVVHGKDIMICEDVLSARKWLEADPSNGVVCLFGAKASSATPSVSSSDPLYLVWLDNDQARIDEVAAEIGHKLGTVYSSNVVVVQGGTDPKRYTKGELLNVRDQARKLCGSAPPADRAYHVLEVPIPDQRVRAGLGVKRNPS